MYELTGEHLMKCFGITATEADLPVSAKSFGLGYLDQDCCVGAWSAQVPDYQTTARVSQMETRVC